MHRLSSGCGALAVALLATSPASAHGDHGGGGGIVLPQGTTLVMLSYDVVNYKPLGDDRLLALSAQGDNAHSLSRIAVPSLSLAYGLTRDVTLGVRVPYLANKSIDETGEDPDNPDIVRRGGVYGFGDLTVTGTFRLVREESAGVEASMIVGFKAPTGRTDAVDKDGVLFETEHQPGSGAWDGLVGGTASKRLGAITLSANVLYAATGHGDQDTKLGNRLNWGVGGSYRIWLASLGGAGAMHLGAATRPDGIMHHGGPHAADGGHGGNRHGSGGDGSHAHAPATTNGGVALDISLGLNGQWWDRQTIAGLADDNTGGNVVYFTPGLRLTVDRWAGFVNVGLPIAKDLNGIQSEPSWQLSTGVAVQF